MFNILMQFNHISLIQQAKSLIFVGRNYTKTTIVFPLPHKLHNFLKICGIFRSGSQGSRSHRKGPKYVKLKGFSFVKEVLLLCLFGISLPTVDVYSDGALIIQLYTDTTQQFRCLSDGKVIRAREVRRFGNQCSDGSDERGKKTIIITNSTQVLSSFNDF